MIEDTRELDELVVVGYGTQRKKDLTGAVGVVDTKENEKTAVAKHWSGTSGTGFGCIGKHFGANRAQGADIRHSWRG